MNGDITSAALCHCQRAISLFHVLNIVSNFQVHCFSNFWLGLSCFVILAWNCYFGAKLDILGI